MDEEKKNLKEEEIKQQKQEKKLKKEKAKEEKKLKKESKPRKEFDFKKCLKIILIIVVILAVLAVLYGIYLLRNKYIIVTMKNLATENLNNTNYHITRKINDNGQIITTNIYYLEGNIKSVAETEGRSNIIVTVANGLMILRDNGYVKTMMYYNSSNFDISDLYINNYAKLNEEKENIVSDHIKNQTIDGKKYYVVTKSSAKMYNDQTKEAKVYIDKETGLVTKVEDKKDGKDYITTYEYEFNTVTADDLSVPNISDYQVVTID